MHIDLLWMSQINYEHKLIDVTRSNQTIMITIFIMTYLNKKDQTMITRVIKR